MHSKLMVMALMIVVAATAKPAYGQEEVTVESLRRERRDTFRSLVDALKARNASGQADILEVLVAQRQLLKAELQLASTKPEQIMVHEQIVENLRVTESLMKSRHDAGRETLENAMRAKARRLKAAIRLLQAKARHQSPAQE